MSSFAPIEPTGQPGGHSARGPSQATVLVLPSLSEGLGRVVFEAMATGTPVIGSCVGGIRDMIVDGETVFLTPPGDVADLVDRLRWILRHAQKAHEMGERAREFAKTFFSQEKYAYNYGRLIELVSQPSQVQGALEG